MTLFFHLKASTERRFRETAMKRHGYSKGALKKALEEAIEDWLARNGNPPLSSEEEAEEKQKERMANEKKQNKQKENVHESFARTAENQERKEK